MRILNMSRSTNFLLTSLKTAILSKNSLDHLSCSTGITGKSIGCNGFTGCVLTTVINIRNVFPGHVKQARARHTNMDSRRLLAEQTANKEAAVPA